MGDRTHLWRNLTADIKGTINQNKGYKAGMQTQL